MTILNIRSLRFARNNNYNNTLNYSLNIKDGHYLKQISNEYSRYNQSYLNDINERCLDTRNKHFTGHHNKITSGHQHLQLKHCFNKYPGLNNIKKGIINYQVIKLPHNLLLNLTIVISQKVM